MLLRLSLLLIIALAGSALVATGYAAFGQNALADGAGTVQNFFASLPREAAFAAPVLAAAAIAALFVVLRVLGFMITAAFTVGAVTAALAVGFHHDLPQLIDMVKNVSEQ